MQGMKLGDGTKKIHEKTVAQEEGEVERGKRQGC